MSAQASLRRKLLQEFMGMKAKNPAYSMRAFARKLGISSGALSAILGGKRRVSYRMAQKILKPLRLDPQDRAEILELFRERAEPDPLGTREYVKLGEDQFHAISDWHHFAILSLIHTRDSRPETAWIASRLGISRELARDALERLARLEMIVFEEGKELRRTHPKYRTPDDVRSASLRRAHLGNLELARRSLERDEVDARDFTSITMAIDPSRLALAKEKLRSFQDGLSELLEDGERTEVYKLCMQLFPLSAPAAGAP